MNKHLERIMKILRQDQLTTEQREDALKVLKEAEKEFEITEFKLNRTEKAKRTTEVLFEETIAELEQKRKAIVIQNRELEVEAALERVRAMTMAMYTSEDIGKCIVSMFSELTALGVDEGTRFGIGILNHDNENNQLWTARKDGEEVKMHIGNIDMASHPLLKSARKAWKEQVPFHQYILEGQDLLDYYQMLNNAPDYKIQIPLEQLPEREIQHCFIFEHGFFYAFSPKEFQPELIHITKRFSSLFEQTYRRYMDLQKAEAQAREAQIQLSLERIRAKAMAMQHSDELSDFLTVVFEQFEVLNLNPVFCHLSFFDIENNRFTYRMTGRTGAAVIATQEIDLEATPLWKQNVEDWKSGHPYQVGGLYIPKERFPEMTEIFNEILSKLPEEERPKIEDYPDGQYVVDGYCKYGYLGYSASRPPTDEEKEITRRIANEFGNVYQRFIDLQKAEAQAREAQIQLSLERIRAKAMAMQHSDELSDFLTVVFEQFEVLNLNPVNCHLAFLDIENNRSIFRLTGKNGATLIATQEINLDASPIWIQKVEAWKSGRFTDVDVLFVPFEKLPEIGEIFKEILDKIPENDRPLPEDYPDGQYVVDGYCKYGYLGYSASRPPTDEEKEITRRIANEFGNVYQRFIDLQKAEDQAREAQIQLSLERIRAKAMSMQHSDELSDFLTVVFEQFEVLNLSPVNCILSLYDIENNRSTFRMTGKNGATLIATQEIDLDASPVWKKKIEDFKLGHPNDVDVLFIPYERLPEIAEIFKEIIGKLPEDERPQIEEDYPNGEYVIDGYCKYGYLGYSASRPPSDEEKEITRRIANEFGNVYQRFLDLQKAEAQAREAQIQLSLERIRAKAMAMQHSDELSDFLTVLFEQFDVLNTSPVYCQLSLIDIENNRNIFRMTGKKGSTLIASQEVDLNASTVWKQKVSDWKAGNPNDVDVLHIPKEIMPKMAEIFKEIWSKLPEAEQPTPEDFPNGSYVVEGYCKYGYIGYTASRPPSDEEKEITRRIANEFGNVYQRFLDLEKAEKQAREAQIEAALERIRSKTMAMHKSDQLPETAQVLFEQFVLLGKIPDRISIGIFNEELQVIELWVTDQTGSQLASHFNTSFLKPTISEFFAAWKKGKDSIIVDLSGDALKEWIAYVRDEVKMPIDESKIKGRRVHHAAFFSQGMLLISAHEPMLNETMQLLVRFAKVFSQTYTRFLDLQKAEAQAREAQIEAGLERVRSKTMAMHSSEDVDITVITLFEELVKLGVDKSIRSGIGIMALSRKMEVWTASVNFSGQTTLDKGVLDMGAHQLLIEVQEAWEAKKSTHTYELIGDDLNNYFKSINDTPDYSFQIDLEKLPGKIIHYDFYFPEGVLFAFSPVPFSEETARLFSRFAAVFAQTYRRFLDLQKAEAQARESEIEVALEKVRSRSLAMHKSDELKDVVFSVFERLRDLQIQTDSTNIVVYHDESEKMEVWTANDMNYATKFSLPMTGRFYSIEGIEARKEQKFFMQYLPFEEKNRFWEELFQTSDFRKVPEIRKTFLLEKTDCLIQLVAFGKLTGIMLIRHFNTPFSDAEIEITERFAKVFDQAYTRFLDLQKAEKQAREAQIESALEKVRSRSLAMQSPDELIEVAQLLREEMGALGVEELETSSIYIHDEDSGKTQCWFTIKNTDDPGKAVSDQMTITLEETWVGRQMREFFHSPAEKTSIVMRGENRLEWIHYCEGKTNLFGTSNFYGDTIPERTYHLYKFSNGYIGAAAPGEISQESWDLLRRATTVFSFAYTRFQDLQNAQASARAAQRQASLDRIRADISSMRNADDLDRITPLIFKELTVLGVPFIRCGVFIINEKQELVEAYLSSPDGNSLGVLRLPYQASELTFQTVKAWRKGEIYKRHWNKEDFIQWINQLMEQDQIQDSSTYQGTAAPPESLDLHFVPFTQGMLYVGAVNPLEENELELVQALSKAFSIAYARYEDFVKLESAKAEVESAMKELKSTQTQLVQQEKLASLGQLTAGIAHEIKNPLNFVNNFSEVSLELIEEALEEIAQIEGNEHAIESAEILTDIKSNLTKIHEHGSRANSIVSSMLQHSRGGSGKMEPTDLNALIKEYVNLSFHGMRAGKNPINVDIILELNPEIKEVSLIKEDFTRVIINLCNNAFDAMRGKVDLTGFKGYHPSLKVSTSQLPPEGGKGGYFKIAIQDNGPGIPDDIKDKILQPFFTTKKGTEGTGLGLSITNDIIKAHGGSISISSDSNGSIFTVIIPQNS